MDGANVSWYHGCAEFEQNELRTVGHFANTSHKVKRNLF